jgi:hypothetical protein
MYSSVGGLLGRVLVKLLSLETAWLEITRMLDSLLAVNSLLGIFVV